MLNVSEEAKNRNPEDLPDGIDNLLKRCVRADAGSTLLIVGEAGPSSYYDDGLCGAVEQAANSLGIDCRVIYTDPVADATQMPEQVALNMSSADAIVFFSRLGDRIRFVETPGEGKKVMCYTLTDAHMRSSFATIGHDRMTQMLQMLEANIHSSSHYQITTRDGTNLTGEIISDADRGSSKPFHVELFPVVIFEPVNCYGLAGELMISRFITSTSTRAYDGSVLMIESPICAHIKDSAITSMTGDRQMIRRVDHQLTRAAQLSGGDPYVLNSWHAGINPGTFFVGNPFDDVEYWGTVAFGSPRYAHIHAAGVDPGDIAYHLMDATIRFDGEVFWQDGRFLFLDRPEIQSLFTPKERAVLNSGHRLDIGL